MESLLHHVDLDWLEWLLLLLWLLEMLTLLLLRLWCWLLLLLVLSWRKIWTQTSHWHHVEPVHVPVDGSKLICCIVPHFHYISLQLHEPLLLLSLYPVYL